MNYLKTPRIRPNKILILSSALFILAGGASLADQTDTSVSETKKTTAVNEVTILSAGDIMAHMPQIKAQFLSNDKGYNFNSNYVYVKPIITQADLSLANLETTLAGKEKGYSGYPQFNAPDALANGILYAGFDVVSTVNNHAYDTGKAGLIRTWNTVSKSGLMPIGTRPSVDKLPYQMVDLNGIAIGVTAYSYETDPNVNKKALNGIPVSESVNSLIDTFNPSALDVDLKQMVKRVNQMRADGAECVVVFIHWGDEYAASPNASQVKIAQTLCEAGVDIIFGSHPHVVQRVDLLKNKRGDHETLVAYSMGNFISNQRAEYTKDAHTEDGLMVNVTIKRDSQAKRVEISRVNLYPTWVNRYKSQGKFAYEIVPLTAALKNPKAFNLQTIAQKKNAQQSLERTLKRVGKLKSRIEVPQE